MTNILTASSLNKIQKAQENQRKKGEELTQEEVEAYNAGYDWNEIFGGKKEW